MARERCRWRSPNPCARPSLHTELTPLCDLSLWPIGGWCNAFHACAGSAHTLANRHCDETIDREFSSTGEAIIDGATMMIATYGRDGDTSRDPDRSFRIQETMN